MTRARARRERTDADFYAAQRPAGAGHFVVAQPRYPGGAPGDRWADGCDLQVFGEWSERWAAERHLADLKSYRPLAEVYEVEHLDKRVLYGVRVQTCEEPWCSGCHFSASFAYKPPGCQGDVCSGQREFLERQERVIPCECGAVGASWHAEEEGLRVYACDACYPTSGAPGGAR